jgi:hypothetical protein
LSSLFMELPKRLWRMGNLDRQMEANPSIIVC